MDAYEATVVSIDPLGITVQQLGDVLLEPCVKVGTWTPALGDHVLAIRTDNTEPDSETWWLLK